MLRLQTPPREFKRLFKSILCRHQGASAAVVPLRHFCRIAICVRSANTYAWRAAAFSTQISFILEGAHLDRRRAFAEARSDSGIFAT
jgi:hypothetical protein